MCGVWRRRLTFGLAAALVGVMFLAALVFGALRPAPHVYDLGRLNSVEEREGGGRLCVNDSYDENHCRQGRPLILPAEPLATGDCLEVRTQRGSTEIAVRKVASEPCFDPYNG